MAKINVTVEVPDDDDCFTETSNSKYICPFAGPVYVETFTCKIFNKKIIRYGNGGKFRAKPCKECLDSRIKNVRKEKHIKTNEDWYPTLGPYQKSKNPKMQFNNPYPYNVVYVMMTILSDGLWRVAVLGMDDFGLEKDVKTKEEAQNLYDNITDYTTQHMLRERGFYHI